MISIVPRLPPAIDGLGDYALNLARQLRKAFNVETHFIVGDPAASEAEQIERFAVDQIAERSPATLVPLLSQNSTVLLHYVGYGYEKRGCPRWLVHGLETWRQENPARKLITMFHEVYATGAIWNSSFWLSSLQKHLAARLTRVSDACFTSRQGYAEILRALSRDKHRSIPTLPVFSNVGEPKVAPPPLRDRHRRLVVFGGSANRARVYEKSLASLEITCRELAIETVLDIGPPIERPVSHVNGVPVVSLGKMPADEISDVLSNSVAGFFDYNTTYLAKSTIYAAYSTHGLIPVNAFREGSREDGLEAGKHYWLVSSRGKRLSMSEGQEIADNARAWYQTHNLSEQVKTFAEVIGLQNLR